ncbi:MAG: SufS family cysteine desulfurase [Gemmatimonadaceae bacterium]|nr:SufS family cysteine desulfurase [Gemmatimonadaceae bacterium]
MRASTPVELAKRADFPLLLAQPELVYLDSAATAQKPAAVLDALRRYYESENANPHRGAYALSAAATEAYHKARQRVARFVGIADADQLIFVRGTTEGMNLVATAWGRANVSRGDNVVVTRMEHHANFVPWQQLARAVGAEFRIVELDAAGNLDLEMLSRLVDARTKVVAFGHVSNALGTINPVAKIVAAARAAAPSALLVCDGAQAVPHLAVEVDALGVDVYAFSGHKVGGPMGIGAVFVRRPILDAMPPYQFGGDMIEWVNDDDSTWNVIPHKFEAGTPNVAGAVGLAAACDFLDGLGMEAVRRHELLITTAAMRALSEIEGVTVFGTPTAEGRSGVVSFAMADVHPHDVATSLDAAGVCVRAGHHCAQPLMRRLSVPATTRASFWIYNTLADVDALARAVRATQERFAGV